jgi:hypothetical protein
MKKKLIAASVAAGFIIFIFVLLANINTFVLVYKMHYLYLLPFLFFALLIMAVHVFRWQIILLAHNKSIGFRKLFLYKLAGFSISYFTPSAHIGGEPVRAWLLKQNHIKYSHGLSTILIDKFIEVGIYVLVGFVGFIFMIVEFTIPNDTIFLFALIFVVLGIFIFYKRMTERKPVLSYLFRISGQKKIVRMRKTIEKSEEMISIFFNRKKRILLASLFLTLITYVLMFFEFHFLLLVLGLEPGIPVIFLITSLVAISFIIPVPAGLGVLEAFQASLFALLGFGASFGVGLSLIIRVKDVLVSLLGLGYLTGKGIKALGLR